MEQGVSHEPLSGRRRGPPRPAARRALARRALHRSNPRAARPAILFAHLVSRARYVEQFDKFKRNDPWWDLESYMNWEPNSWVWARGRRRRAREDAREWALARAHTRASAAGC